MDDPRPLVFVIGAVDSEPDIHARLLKGVEGTVAEVDREIPSLLFRSVPVDYAFLEKKPSLGEPSLEGVLKASWIEKHTNLLPSVVCVLTPFSVDWSANEWVRREAALAEKYGKLRSILSTREVKPFLVAVKIGVGLGIIDQDVMDERIISLKRLLQLDSRTFTFMTQQDLTALSPPMRKLCKNVREFSSAYYAAQVKRVQRNLEQRAMTIQRTFMEGILPARYALKIGFFSSFLGQRQQALRYYRQSFQVVASLIGHVSPDIENQLKHVAELLSGKICAWLLQGGLVRDAALQLRSLLSLFSPKGRADVEWRHFAWLASQHILFAQLLERHDPAGSDESADRSSHLEAAAKLTMQRQAAFAASRGSSALLFGVSPLSPSIDDAVRSSQAADRSQRLQDLILTPPRFLGSPPQVLGQRGLLDAGNGNGDAAAAGGAEGEGSSLARQYFEEQEQQVNHSAIIADLLQGALAAARPYAKRRKAQLKSLLAEQCMSEGDFDLAAAHLAPLQQLLCSEGWVAAAAPALRRSMSCSLYLGRPREYLKAALTLYAACGAQLLVLGRFELEELHRDVFSVLSPSSPSPSLSSSQGDDDGTGAALILAPMTPPRAAAGLYVAVPDRPEFGMAAPIDQPAEPRLPPGYSVDMGPGSNLFRCSVSFSAPSAALGSVVQVVLRVTSLFAGTVSFAELSVVMAGGLLSTRIVHCQSQQQQQQQQLPSACLEFAPGGTVEVSFPLVLPASLRDMGSGSGQGQGEENCLFVERLRFTLPHASGAGAVLDSSALSPGFLRALEANRARPTPLALRDLVLYAGADGPPVLTVLKPSPALVLVPPPAPGSGGVELLSGPLQRFDVALAAVGEAGARSLRAYLSSDSSGPGPLFWFPSQSQAEADAKEEEEEATFHPLQLTSSQQPAACLLLGDVPAGGSVIVPLFLRAATPGVVRLRLRVEFLSQAQLDVGAKDPSSLDFDLRVVFLSPLAVAFRWLPPPTGAVVGHAPPPPAALSPSPSASVVVVPVIPRGSPVALQATVSCSSALTQTQAGAKAEGVEVLSMRLAAAPAAAAEVWSSFFRPAPIDPLSSCELLLAPLDLHTGESAAGSAQVFFAEPLTQPPDTPLPELGETAAFVAQCEAQSAAAALVSVGELLVTWRPRLRGLLTAPSGRAADSHAGSWLPKLCVGVGAALGAEQPAALSEACDVTTCATALCVENFAVPNVQLRSSPLDVRLVAPALCRLGQVQCLRVEVRNHRWTHERMLLQADVGEHYVITGNTTCALDVAPRGSASVSVAFVPLRSGHVPLPALRVAWEREGSPLLDSSLAPPIFVAP
jgi:hypothetical protein